MGFCSDWLMRVVKERIGSMYIGPSVYACLAYQSPINPCFNPYFNPYLKLVSTLAVRLLFLLPLEWLMINLTSRLQYLYIATLQTASLACAQL